VSSVKCIYMFSETRTPERKKEIPEEWKQLDLFTAFFPFAEGKKEMSFPDDIALSVDVDSKSSENEGETSYKVDFLLEKNTDQIQLTAYVSLSSDKDGSVRTSLRRISTGERSLPEGIGAQLYTKFLDCLQQIANSQNINIVHDILTVPAKGMNWHKVFDPIIREYGYEGPFSSSDEDEVYVKTYTPENKTTSGS
jgi:hypothetical protein